MSTCIVAAHRRDLLLGDGADHLLERRRAVGGVELAPGALRVEQRVRGGVQQRLLVVEDAEQRPLRHPRRLGDLPGGDPGAVLEQQRHDRLHERRAALVGRQRGSATRR